MSRRWIDSLDLAEGRNYDAPLYQALSNLSLAAWCQRTGEKPSQYEEYLRIASALIVVERRRLTRLVSPDVHVQGRRENPDSPSMIQAVLCVAYAIDHGGPDYARLGDQKYRQVSYLRTAEAHLRAIWKAGR